jgi:hypothetical protein
MDQDDTVIDAVMMSEKPDPQWSKEHFAAAADFLHKQGAWLSADGGIPGPQDAVGSTSTTTSRSISRDETSSDTNRAGDWYITDIAMPRRENRTAQNGIPLNRGRVLRVKPGP